MAKVQYLCACVGRTHTKGAKVLIDDSIPRIDPTVKHIGVSKLRGLNATKLRDSTDTFVIQENDTPLAVLVNYEKFLIMQEQLLSVFNTLEMLTDSAEVKAVMAALEDAAAGRVRSLADIRAELKDRG